jgi:hypothetical protein
MSQREREVRIEGSSNRVVRFLAVLSKERPLNLAEQTRYERQSSCDPTDTGEAAEIRR